MRINRYLWGTVELALAGSLLIWALTGCKPKDAGDGTPKDSKATRDTKTTPDTKTTLDTKATLDTKVGATKETGADNAGPLVWNDDTAKKIKKAVDDGGFGAARNFFTTDFVEVEGTVKEVMDLTVFFDGKAVEKKIIVVEPSGKHELAGVVECDAELKSPLASVSKGQSVRIRGVISYQADVWRNAPPFTIKLFRCERLTPR